MGPLLDVMDSQHLYFNPGQNICIDEGMIKYKGRLSFKQYMPAKPTKYGVKFFSVCDSVTGFCLRIVIYIGRENRFAGGEGFVYNIVDYLLLNYYQKNHICYTDNFYTSIKLANHLITNRTHLCGTIRKNSRNFPKLHQQPLQRGDNIKLANNDGIVVCRWWDKRDILSLSTCTDGHDVEITRRNATVKKPHLLIRYNEFMGGVDKSDQLRSYHRVGRPSIKWWKTVFNGVLNICIINAYVLYNNKNKVSVRDFKLDLARQLMDDYNMRKRHATTNISGPSLPKVNMLNHAVELTNNLRICVQCKKEGRKTSTNGNIRTKYRCTSCNVNLCSKSGSTCFVDFHK